MTKEFSTGVVGLFKRAASEQGGLLAGKDPTKFNASDPIRLFIIQLGIIIMMTQLLAFFLRKIKQPQVIAEVLGGIILGPTVFGRIPGFTDHIFPLGDPETHLGDSRSYLSLVANIGLCLFLFLVGLEIDIGVVMKNARLSATISLAGMVLPFGLGAALAVPIYQRFIDQSVEFTHFMLFTSVAFSITAFPVLCRILSELKLIDTTVGIVVLSAGVGNDIIGWTLLALSVALVNAGSGVVAVYILLVAVGFALIILIPVKRLFLWIAYRTGSVESGPTKSFLTIILLSVFAAAFFTDIIGIHAIFGAFLIGLVVPREGGLAIHITEKIEDLVSILFLPLYFTLSGLSTDLGLLNDGITWGYTIAIIVLAFLGKFIGCTVAARFSGFTNREAAAIGSLMSCKGLVELIVLNVGLSAGILSQRVFSMFVLEALVLTFATTPLVRFFYPPEIRTRVSAIGGTFNNVGDGAENPKLTTKVGDDKQRFTVVLDRLEHLPGMMAFTQLLQPGGEFKDERRSVDGLRIMELSDRTSAVMKSSQTDTLLQVDPILNVFRMFAQLYDLTVSSALAIVPYEEMSFSVIEHASKTESDLILVPWLPPSNHYTVPAEEVATTPRAVHSHNPFDAMFKSSQIDTSVSAIHSHFVRGIFSRSKVDVALFIDRGYPSTSGHQIYLPFFGGPDDRLALDFVVQLCKSDKVSATIVRVATKDIGDELEKPEMSHAATKETKPATLSSSSAPHGHVFPDTVYGHGTTETRLESDTADNIAWSAYAKPPSTTSASTTVALSRIQFRDLASPAPLHLVVQEATALTESGSQLIVVLGRSRRLATETHAKELKGMMEESGHVRNEVNKTLGDPATAFMISGCQSNLVVLQAALPTD